MGDHYEALQRQTGKTLSEPVFPKRLTYLWNLFIRLHQSRTGNGFGPNPIPWHEIWAYCQLTRTALAAWEIEAIRALDEAFLMAVAKDAGGAT